MIYVKAMIRRIAEKLQLDLDMQNVVNKDAKNKYDDSKKTKTERKPSFNTSYIYIPILALATLFLGASTAKLGFELLLRDNKPTQIINPSSTKILPSK